MLMDIFEYNLSQRFAIHLKMASIDIKNEHFIDIYILSLL